MPAINNLEIEMGAGNNIAAAPYTGTYTVAANGATVVAACTVQPTGNIQYVIRGDVVGFGRVDFVAHFGGGPKANATFTG
jgi:hypothetical protein